MMAMSMVRVGQFLNRNCVQANGDVLEVLPHIILYLSTRQPQDIGSPGHAWTGIFVKNGLDM